MARVATGLPSSVPARNFHWRTASIARANDLRQSDCCHSRFTASVVWAPNYSVNSRIERGFVDGWSLSGTVTATNGTPFTGFVQSSSSQSLNGVTAPDGGMTGAEVSTFAGPTGGRASWLGRNSFNLPNRRRRKEMNGGKKNPDEG